MGLMRGGLSSMRCFLTADRWWLKRQKTAGKCTVLVHDIMLTNGNCCKIRNQMKSTEEHLKAKAYCTFQNVIKKWGIHVYITHNKCLNVLCINITDAIAVTDLKDHCIFYQLLYGLDFIRVHMSRWEWLLNQQKLSSSFFFSPPPPQLFFSFKTRFKEGPRKKKEKCNKYAKVIIKQSDTRIILWFTIGQQK